MAKYPVRLGVVCLARKTFDYTAAEKLYQEQLEELQGLEALELEAIPRLVIEVAEAREAGQALAARRVDGLLRLSGTFQLGHLVLELHKAVQRPIQLWAFPELPHDGGKIRLNSLCGLNLDASNLYKAGVRDYHAALGPHIDEDWIDALRALRALHTAHIGLVGFRAHGFFNVDLYDPALYRNTRVLLDHFELQELAREEQIASTFEVSGLSREQLRLAAGLTARLGAFLRRHELSALAIRCWPEFAANYGISPCSDMSVLQAEGRVLACEGDVDGALSMLAQSAVGAENPYLFDFSQANFEEDYALLWHCGVAPCNLRDGECVRSLDTYFAGGKGVTADFVLKPGPISYLRLDSCGEQYRVLVGRGQGLPMVREVYGEHVRPFELLAKIRGWELIR